MIIITRSEKIITRCPSISIIIILINVKERRKKKVYIGRAMEVEKEAGTFCCKFFKLLKMRSGRDSAISK